MSDILPALPEELTSEIGDQFPISIILLKSRSQAWGICVSLCKRAPFFREEKGNVAVGYNFKYEDLENLAQVLDISQHWKNVFVFLHGKYVKKWQLTSWINCYKEYLRSPKNSYCTKPVESFYFRDKYQSPCININEYGLDESADLKHSLMIQAEKWGHAYCPRFNINRFKILGTSRFASHLDSQDSGIKVNIQYPSSPQGPDQQSAEIGSSIMTKIGWVILFFISVGGLTGLLKNFVDEDKAGTGALLLTIAIFVLGSRWKKKRF